MAGVFIASKYKADNGDVYRIKIQPETALLAFGSAQNAPTVNAVNQQKQLRVRKSVKENGLTTRKVGVRWVTNPPATYKPSAILYVPILTPELFLAIQLDQQATYLGGTVIVVSKLIER